MILDNLYKEIFDYAKKRIVEDSQYNPSVFLATPKSSKIFPVVIFNKQEDNLKNENLKKAEQKYNLIIDINIYSSNKGKVNKEVIVSELAEIVDKVMQDEIGFKRIDNKPLPNIDETIDRRYLEYSGVYDSEQNKIYRN